MSRDKKARFDALAPKRLERAIAHIRLVGNLANRSNYEFVPEDCRPMIESLDREVALLRLRFGIKD
jgi:hypothetical protein